MYRGLWLAVCLYVQLPWFRLGKYFFNILNIKTDVYYSTASVVYWSEFLATDTEVPGSIPGATRFSE